MRSKAVRVIMTASQSLAATRATNSRRFSPFKSADDAARMRAWG